MPQPDLWEKIKGAMDSILQAGIWLVGIIVLFVVTPPRMTPADDSQIFVRAAQFIVAIVMILVAVAARRSDWSLRKLWISTAVTLLASVSAFFAYLYFLLSRTCEYDGRGPMVTGDAMLPAAEKYAAGPPPKDCRTMILDVAGDTEKIWPKGEILINYLALSASFIATVCLFALALMLAVELVKKARIR